jgi:hypothetical protein
MAFMGFMSGASGHGLNTSWFMFSSAFLEIEKVHTYANIENDHCSIEKVEWDAKDKYVFRVHVQDISRKYISEKVDYQFHLVYTTLNGRAYEQTVKYDGESRVKAPRELLYGDGSIWTSL